MGDAFCPEGSGNGIDSVFMRAVLIFIYDLQVDGAIRKGVVALETASWHWR